MKPSESIESADKVLEGWDDVCNELNIPHFLIYGTCLGFYRDGGYIKGDVDIDTRVMCNKKMWKKLVMGLNKKGIIHENNSAGWAFKGDNIHLSIERSEKVGLVIHDDGKEWPAMPLYYSFDTILYKGRKYNMPHPVEKYLEGRYGKDWKIPNPNWDKYKDAKGA